MDPAGSAVLVEQDQGAGGRGVAVVVDTDRDPLGRKAEQLDRPTNDDTVRLVQVPASNLRRCRSRCPLSA